MFKKILKQGKLHCDSQILNVRLNELLSFVLCVCFTKVASSIRLSACLTLSAARSGVSVCFLGSSNIQNPWIETFWHVSACLGIKYKFVSQVPTQHPYISGRLCSPPSSLTFTVSFCASDNIERMVGQIRPICKRLLGGQLGNIDSLRTCSCSTCTAHRLAGCLYRICTFVLLYSSALLSSTNKEEDARLSIIHERFELPRYGPLSQIKPASEYIKLWSQYILYNALTVQLVCPNFKVLATLSINNDDDDSARKEQSVNHAHFKQTPRSAIFFGRGHEGAQTDLQVHLACTTEIIPEVFCVLSFNLNLWKQD